MLIGACNPMVCLIHHVFRPDSCQTSVDLLFVLDGSGSMNGYFPGELTFVRQVIQQFNVGANSTRVAALTYASGATLNFNFLGEGSGSGAGAGLETWFYQTGQAEIACGQFRAATVTAGGRASWTFVAPNRAGSVTFSTCATAGDTVLYLDGSTSRIDRDSCGRNERQTLTYTANQRIPIAAGYYSSGSAGLLRLDAVCDGAAVVIPQRPSSGDQMAVNASRLARDAVLARVDEIAQPGGGTMTSTSF